ncbi:hypothetical protein MBM_01545 [Drepanopeziza brunnea f. sp. 'multigermtubi' MB_m1]|uniref:Uncharacterized protein n=1 Tax=Marssonina brunnea f. sp. multigermtubi (strain MB_m1) TaxID=1072389 RepID=K1XJJ4_MARBU|nr:uncharacterized protein MBM_01545 [Drepanopeziza brunnea f. sp. 'multigermtubi' MB_m1]EKD20863.1 hypothetical protein MBM_01545 [Drepanopeziza brunnea f. sp. 'multigermtubi' MB_m1]
MTTDVLESKVPSQGRADPSPRYQINLARATGGDEWREHCRAYMQMQMQVQMQTQKCNVNHAGALKNRASGRPGQTGLRVDFEFSGQVTIEPRSDVHIQTCSPRSLHASSLNVKSSRYTEIPEYGTNKATYAVRGATASISGVYGVARSGVLSQWPRWPRWPEPLTVLLLHSQRISWTPSPTLLKIVTTSAPSPSLFNGQIPSIRRSVGLLPDIISATYFSHSTDPALDSTLYENSSRGAHGLTSLPSHWPPSGYPQPTDWKILLVPAARPPEPAKGRSSNSALGPNVSPDPFGTDIDSLLPIES